MKLRKWGAAAISAAVLGVAGAASAHQLDCEKTANGVGTYTIPGFPASVDYVLRVINTHPSATSEVRGLEDALLEDLVGFVFAPAPPFPLAVGASQVYEPPTLPIASAEQCRAYAALDGREDLNIDNYFRATWDLGEVQCHARVVCPPPPPPPEGGATRTLGFFKTHPGALSACLAELGGSVDLGFVTIDSLEEALGFLWGRPSRFEDGSRRNELDRLRFLLGRQTLVGLCNEALFGTTPAPPTLLEDALAALDGTVCSDISGLIGPVDAFNNSGDDEDFPEGFSPGSADPDAGMDEADPTTPSGEVCSP